MALELAGGAVLGATVGELLKAVLDAKQKASAFQPSLARLELTLKSMVPRIDQISRLNNQLNLRQSEMEELISLINNGKELVVKCSKISTINYVRKVQYTKELLDLDHSLFRYFVIILPLDHIKDTKEILILVKRLEMKLVNHDQLSESSSAAGTPKAKEDSSRGDGKGEVRASSDSAVEANSSGLESESSQDGGGEEKSSSSFSRKIKSFSKQQKDSQSHSDVDYIENNPPKSPRYDSAPLPMPFDISTELKPPTLTRTRPSTVAPVSSFLGRAGIVAVEVLDSLGFIYGTSSKGSKISILAFEVANTIVKGANLMQSLSEEDIQFLKKDILYSEGVQQLVSTDMKELLSIAAADKRDEFDVLCREVTRFGDLCIDPQWHNLGPFFEGKLRFDLDYTTHKQLSEEADMSMQKLTTLAEHTSELYHELHALDRFEHDYSRKLEEVEALNLPRRGESIMLLQSELKQQRKVVRSLKKKSLWSRNLEEIVEKFVDIITFIRQEILEAFGENGMASNVRKGPTKSPHRLGQAGLALHYANIINQIDTIASLPTSLPPNVRDTLYNGLPPSVKSSLRSRLRTADAKEELTMALIKAEMEKTLQWLVPVAANTIKAHQGFGWVGEWANTSNEYGKKTATNGNLIRLQTLYHSDKQKTDIYILELVIWLHRLISSVRYRDRCFNPQSVRSPSQKGLVFHSNISDSHP